MKRIFFLGGLSLLLAGACFPDALETLPAKTVNPAFRPPRQPKNVILLIGEGMGLTQISAGMYMNNDKLQIERFPVIGIQKPYASDNLVTDNAAAATALACGVKTKNGSIGVGKDGKPVKTLMEEAKEKGYAVGIVSTSSLTSPANAAFLAHEQANHRPEVIADAYLTSGIDFFVGGGKKYFTGRESDTRDLYQELEQKGYQVSDFSKADIPRVTLDFQRNFAFFAADQDPPASNQGRNYLQPASRLGAVFLQSHNEKGFLMVVNSSQIALGGQNNDSDLIISEMLDFDRTVGALLDFAKENGETLVILTALNEAGGYAINPGSEHNKILPAFNSQTNTGALVPVFAFGPGSELFSGIYDNTEIHHRIRKALGWN